jgi:hypothetical protein
VNHPSVSRVHAEVHALGDGRYELVDSGSANGIRVNGVELPRGLLDSRDMIELGDVVFKFIPAGDVYVPGADESQQISSLGGFEAASGEARGMTTGAKLLIGLGAAALLGTLVLVAVSRGEEPANVTLSVPKGEQTDASAKVLAEAKALLDQGNVVGARERVNQLPEDSNLRESPEFRAIQSTWADLLLDKASRPSEPQRAPEPERPSEPAPAAKVASSPATLVRKNPFDDPGAAEIPAPAPDPGATDRSKLTQTRNQLLAKVRGGTASDDDKRRLRALCRALGDASCSN